MNDEAIIGCVDFQDAKAFLHYNLPNRNYQKIYSFTLALWRYISYTANPMNTFMTYTVMGMLRPGLSVR